MAWPTRRWTAAPGASPLGVTRRPPPPTTRRRRPRCAPSLPRRRSRRRAGGLRPLRPPPPLPVPLPPRRCRAGQGRRAADVHPGLAGGAVLRPRPPARPWLFQIGRRVLHRPLPPRAGGRRAPRRPRAPPRADASPGRRWSAAGSCGRCARRSTRCRPTVGRSSVCCTSRATPSSRRRRGCRCRSAPSSRGSFRVPPQAGRHARPPADPGARRVTRPRPRRANHRRNRAAEHDTH